jgi:hypothetical protein
MDLMAAFQHTRTHAGTYTTHKHTHKHTKIDARRRMLRSYTHTHTHTHTHTPIYLYIHTHQHFSIDLSIYTFAYTCVYIYIMCMCMTIFVFIHILCVCAYVRGRGTGSYPYISAITFHKYSCIHKTPSNSGFKFRGCNAPVAGDRERAARARRLVFEADSPFPALSCLVYVCMCVREIKCGGMNTRLSLSFSHTR